MRNKDSISRKMPKISVVMSTYNDAKYLESSIKSILSQTLIDFEFIIIDDGSTDMTWDILQKSRKEDPRIRLVRHDKSMKLAKSLNEGIRISRGRYIARMDSDDIAQPTRLQRESDFLDENKDVFLVGCGIEKIDEDGKPFGIYMPPITTDQIEESLEISNCMVHPSVMFRKNSRIYYRENFWGVQDYDFFLRLKDSGLKMWNIGEILLKYRVSAKHTDLRRMLKHSSYKFFAKLYHRERVLYGKDSYENLNPIKLESLKLEDIKESEIFADIIFSSFKTKSYKDCRNYIKAYFGRFGFNIKFLVLYILCLLPKTLIEALIWLRKKITL